MKKHLQLLIVSLMFCCFLTQAQVYKKTIIHAGESVTDPSYYLFPSFSNATIKLKNNGSLNYKVNFNLLLCNIQFINPNNDTLVITEPENIDSIWLNNNVFFFNKSFYEIIASTGNVKLAVLRKISYQPVKIGALGLPDYSGTGIQSYTSFVANVGEKKLTMNEDVVATSETTYYLITNNTTFSKAGKSTFIKVFPGSENALQTYLKQSKVDYNKEADLQKLFQFCSTQN